MQKLFSPNLIQKIIQNKAGCHGCRLKKFMWEVKMVFRRQHYRKVQCVQTFQYSELSAENKLNLELRIWKLELWPSYDSTKTLPIAPQGIQYTIYHFQASLPKHMADSYPVYTDCPVIQP